MSKTLDLCTRCKNLKSIQKVYEFNKAESGYQIRGKCDRCEAWSLDLWPMIEKGVLERLAGA